NRAAQAAQTAHLLNSSTDSWRPSLEASIAAAENWIAASVHEFPACEFEAAHASETPAQTYTIVAGEFEFRTKYQASRRSESICRTLSESWDLSPFPRKSHDLSVLSRGFLDSS